jgi:hypothetical protein
MKPTCKIPYCRCPVATRYTPLSARHEANFRRTLHAEQARCSKMMLKPYLKIVKARMKKNPSNASWITLDWRWVALVDHARRIAGDFDRGKPGNRYTAAAAREVIKLANVDARHVVETTMAMTVCQEFQPRLFRSDRAFWMQLARQVRALTDLNYGERFNPRSGNVQRFYRELAPVASLIMGRWLTEFLGVGGFHIAHQDNAENETRAKERTALHKALKQVA